MKEGRIWQGDDFARFESDEAEGRRLIVRQRYKAANDRSFWLKTLDVFFAIGANVMGFENA